jgi:hypothetical protein
MRCHGLFSLGLHFPRGQGRKLPMCFERRGSFWGHFHMATNDKDSNARDGWEWGS